MSKLYNLPPMKDGKDVDLETKEVLKALSTAHRYLAELKGYGEVLPNQNILINAITLNESKDSSAIENIITTHDELFSVIAETKKMIGPAKEVLNYKEAIWKGFNLIEKKGFLSTNMICDIQAIIEGNNAGIRKQSGTVLMDDQTGDIVYRPPETEDEIRQLMKNLEYYINIEQEIDPLIVMAIVHYQFESIHPFYDGNGRTGRIINILYLVMHELLQSPILYLSKYIYANKNEYYRLFQVVRNEEDWESWILFFLEGITQMAKYSLDQLRAINDLFEHTAKKVKRELPKIYSKELIEIMFSEFYIRISAVEIGLGVTRKTASNYLNQLSEKGILVVENRGRDKIYINEPLVNIIAH